jgi:DME family drug/metabolite transporter
MLSGLLLIALAAISWGTTGAVTTVLVAGAEAEPLLIGTARMVVAATLLGELLTTRVVLALALGVGGTALLVTGPAGGLAHPPRFFLGAGLALTAGLAYALYVIVAKRSLARSAPLPLTAMTFTAAALLMLPSLGWTRAPLDQVVRGWPWLLYLGAVATAGAYAVYALGLRRVPASVAGVVTLLEPLTATLLGVLLFGERLGAAGALGAVMLLGAIGLLCWESGSRPGSRRDPESREG